MVNAGQQSGAPSSIGVAEEVYVSVTSYSKEVRVGNVVLVIGFMLTARNRSVSAVHSLVHDPALGGGVKKWHFLLPSRHVSTFTFFVHPMPR